MIAKLIGWSARNLVLILFATALAVAGGIYSIRTLPLDAIPDLSDVQVIVLTDYPGQAPQVVEDQVTYPLTTAMLTVPKSKVVRGFSFFGVSFVYVIFEDGVDPYWARSRVLEYLNAAASRLPDGVTPALGPDAFGELAGYGLGLERRTPLFYYVLKEAELLEDGLRLGPVGGRIVAEVLLGLLQLDPASYLNARSPWRPTLARRNGAATGEFTMVDFLTFAGVDPTARGQ